MNHNVTARYGTETIPELYGCDGSKFKEQEQEGSVWIIPDGGYIHSEACDAYIVIDEDTKLPDGFGIRVGPGSNIKQLLYCNHYHDHVHVNELLTYTTEQSTLQLQLNSSSTAHPLIGTARLMIDMLPGNISTPDGFKIRVSLKLDDEAVVIPLSFRVHMHAYAHIQERAIVWINGTTTSEPLILANESAFGKMDVFPPLPNPFTIHKSDSLTLECYFKRDPQRSEQELQ